MSQPTVTLHLGDCLDILPTLAAGSVQAIITDLPYGTTACAWDSIIPLAPMWAAVKRLGVGAFITTASQPFTSLLVASNLDWFKYEWVWEKTMATDFLNANNKPLKAHENIAIFSPGTTANCSPNKMTYNPQKETGASYARNYKADRRVGVWDAGSRTPFEKTTMTNEGTRYPRSVLHFPNPNSGNVHPTQKPVALYQYLVETYTNPGDTVLDFCMGSGTTGVACMKLGRNFIGIEKDAGYFAIAQRRIADAQAQLVLPLFAGDGAA